ncbi:MAG: hypothetical protein LUF92_14710, partial [Clostridiales bacterium]|nr:hypothetical protein [Clostridiales bacterium]
MKKIYKKFICIILAATIMVSNGVSVAAASATTTKKYQAAVARYEKFTKKRGGNYKIVDIDGNGIPELLFHNEKNCKDQVYTYNYKKNKMILLAKIDPGQNYMPGASYSGLSYRLSNKSFRIASATTGD